MPRIRTKEGGGVSRIDPGPTTKVRKTIKTRKSKGPTKEDRWLVLDSYMEGKMAHQIAKENDWDTVLTKTYIQKLIQTIRNVHETHVLVDASEIDNAGHGVTHVGRRVTFATVRDIDKQINEQFAPLLSDPMDPILTENEKQYVQMLLATNDWQEAMMIAGFDAGLIKGTDTGYVTALRLRHFYLKKKPNIEAFIRELQAQNLREYKVDKLKIQGSLLQRIQVLENREDPRLEPTLAKYYQLLGQTTGAYTEKIEVTEVSIDDVVKKMLDMRKVQEKERKELGQVHPTDCLSGDNDSEEGFTDVWEYADENYRAGSSEGEEGEGTKVQGEVEERETFDEE